MPSDRDKQREGISSILTYSSGNFSQIMKIPQQDNNIFFQCLQENGRVKGSTIVARIYSVVDLNSSISFFV